MISTLQLSSLEQWYVVQCKTGKETDTAKVLRDAFEMKTYLPEAQLISGKGRKERTPFFPGYFFIYVDLEKVELTRINSTPGILHVLDFGNGPQPMPLSLISDIQEMVNEINAGNRVLKQKFLPGDVVRVKAGPFQGSEAVFVRTLTPHGRVQILLHVLGRASKTQVRKELLEKIKDSPTMRTERRTRGRGRRIRQATHYDRKDAFP